MVLLSLRCCKWAFSSCSEQRLLCCGMRALGVQASVIVVLGISCHVACEIFLDQGWNPCPLH